MAIKPSLLTDTKRYPSPIIWGQTKFEETLRDMAYGLAIKDDFESFHGTLATAVGTHFSRAGGWLSYVDSGDTLAMLATEKTGVLRMATDSTDNDEVNVQLGGAGQLALVSGYSFAWEQRIRVDTLVTQNLFVGFAEEGLAVENGMFDDSDAIADKDYIGFRVLAADSDGLDFVYNTASGGGETVATNVAHTLVANTWVKVGITGNGSTFQAWVNGAKVGDPIAYSATNVPDGEELCLFLSSKNGAGAARTFDHDWFQLWAQVAV